MVEWIKFDPDNAPDENKLCLWRNKETGITLYSVDRPNTVLSPLLNKYEILYWADFNNVEGYEK